MILTTNMEVNGQENTRFVGASRAICYIKKLNNDYPEGIPLEIVVSELQEDPYVLAQGTSTNYMIRKLQDFGAINVINEFVYYRPDFENI